MKKAVLLLMILFPTINILIAKNDQISIIPKPSFIEYLDGEFQIDANTVIFSNTENVSAVNFLADFLRKPTAYQLKIVEKRPAENVIIFRLNKTLDLPNEGYILVSKPDKIILKAASKAGLFYAVQTLRQVLPPVMELKKRRPDIKWTVPCLRIKDKPRFKYRAMHLDVARHFMPKEDVKKYIDYLALYKFNTFHWHLTEDQGWRIEIKKYPKLKEIAQYRESIGFDYNQEIGLNEDDGSKYGGIYTQEDIKEIIEYAKRKHINIIPEFDVPGHCLALLSAYPELGCTGGPYKPWTEAGVSKDVLCAGKPKTYEVVEDIFSEIMELFPGKYIHLGGDEVPKDRWKNCPKCKKLMKEQNLSNMHELQNYFINRIADFIVKNGRTPIGWDEVMNEQLDPNVVVMSWRNYDGGIAAAKKGHKIVMTPNRYTYLNRRQSDNPKSPGHTLITDLKTVYSFDPIPDVLTEEQAKNIIGGEGCVWTEYIPEFKYVEYQIFPRMLALSDIFWTTHPKDFKDLKARIRHNQIRLDEMDVNQYKPLRETEEQRDKRMAWWRDARFGMFIHWGLYSQLAGEYKDFRSIDIKKGNPYAEWIMNQAKIPLEEYRKITQDFDPVKFSAKRWVSLARQAGMKYIIITSKHHEGFCLFDSEYTDYDIIDATPHDRDVLKALEEECEKQNIKLGFYYSILDWQHPDFLPRVKWDDRPVENADFDHYVLYMKNQLKELIKKYGARVLWFDGEWVPTWTHRRGVDLYEYCLNLKPDIIVNNRVDKGRQGHSSGIHNPNIYVGDFGTPEDKIPPTGLPGVDWESCMTMNGTWGYDKNNENWKSAKTLIHELVDVASKGGNFLLNIGPKGNGEIPDEIVTRLKKIGKWMDKYSESIYGTQASIYTNLPFGKCTIKPGLLYLHIFNCPEDNKISVPAKNMKFEKVTHLADGKKLYFEKIGNNFTIDFLDTSLNEIDTVIKVELK